MKVDNADRILGSRRAAASYARAPLREVPAAPPVQPPVSASLFGIPEEEFTPRVRDAITTLMHEVGRLRREAADAKARFEDALRTADQDMLLPVMNRRAFVREITRFIAFAERYGTPSSLLYFDLDNFKAVNDLYGHAGGDAVLRHFADLLLSNVRDTDVVARIGGDEFGVILAHVDRDQAMSKAAKLAQILQGTPPQCNGAPVRLGFSFGAHELRAGENADSAMAHADEAMYARKRARGA